MNRSELRRLKKAVLSNNMVDLSLWATSLENQIRNDLERFYNQKYQNDLLDVIDVFLITIAYVLHFSEETNLGKDKLPDFMQDLIVTIDMFRTKESDIEEYKAELDKIGVEIELFRFERLKESAEFLMNLKRGSLEKINEEIIGRDKVNHEKE